MRLALRDIVNVAALTRLTLPGGRVTPPRPARPASGCAGSPRAARRGATAVDPSVGLIPVFYSAALLQRVGHPSANAALATMTVSPIAPYLSMMDFVDLARRDRVDEQPDLAQRVGEPRPTCTEGDRQWRDGAGDVRVSGACRSRLVVTSTDAF